MPWDPTRDLLTMQERLESLFGRAAAGWVPAVDLAECDAHYSVTIELPGVTREDIRIEFQDQILTIRGARSTAHAAAVRYQQLERGHGTFSRSFRFTAPVVPDSIKADLTDGVLTIVIRKVSERRQIEVL